MGKSDENQTKQRAHKATDDKSKHKNKPSFDATTFKVTHHSQWCDHFRQLCEFNVQFGHSVVSRQYADNPELGNWVANQRQNYRLHQEGKPSSMTAGRMRELESIGFDWEAVRTDWASLWILRIQQLCEFKVQFGHCLVSRQYAANPKLGHWVMTQRNQYKLHQKGEPSLMTEGRIRELESIGFDWGTSKTDLASIWSMRFQQLCEFKEQFGHCLVPGKYSDNPNLRWWVLNQRKNYRWRQEGKPSPMTEDRIRELESIGFDWGTSKKDLASIWNVRIQEIREFKEQFGHCLVPVKYSANPKLRNWVSTQRAKYRLHQEGKASLLTTERIRELESIGFDWEARKTDLASIWNMRFQQLCEFKDQFDHYLVPVKYSANPKLGEWVSNQRQSYRLHQEGKPSSMTAGRFIELESIGFDWEARKTDSTPIWSMRFQQLCEFKEQFGHCLVPGKYADNPKLGGWVSTQRQSFRLHQEGKPSSMTVGRIRELESIGFGWEGRKPYLASNWSMQFQQLCEFKEHFGHCLVPVKYSANTKLRKWVVNQRQSYKHHQEGKPSGITEERIRDLESVGFDWKARKSDVASIWSVRIQEMREFKEQIGHCLVPTKYSANPKLGCWVSTQRKNYRWLQEGKPTPMTENRIRELESIGFDWGEGESIWSVRIQEMRDFKEQFGHCLVPVKYSTYPKLRNWVSTQRTNYRLHQEGKPSGITEERIRDLESVGLTGTRARLIWHPFGTCDFNNCANSRSSSITAWCQSSIRPTPSSGSGLRSSVRTTSCIRKESQVL